MLIITWAILLGVSFAPFGSDHTPAALPISPALRVGSSVVLVLIAWSRGTSSREERYTLWVPAGMLLGCFGDATALVPPSYLPVPRLLLAMGFFGLGHVAYAGGFLGAMRGDRRLVGPMLVSLSVSLLAWQATANAADPPSPLRWPALAYGLLLGSAVASATALARQQPRYLRVAIGATLFLVSDTILGWEAFHRSFPFSTSLCWLTYGPGQMLIVTGWLAGHENPSDHGS